MEQGALEMLKADMHSHFIPGIDDGSPDLETSIALVKGLQELGYSKIITTPHIMGDIYRNRHETIIAGRDAVRKALSAQNIQVDFHAAAEYFLDDYFYSLLESQQPLLTLHDNMVLVEFSFVNKPHNLKDLIFELQVRGYQPVIAHPERYLYLGNNKIIYEEMKDAECLFQLNLLSLTGFYGRATSDLAQYLLQQGWIDLLGTDMHNFQHLQQLQNAPGVLRTVKKLADSGRLLNPSL